MNWSASEAKRGGYPDFMSKEVAEQPEAIERLLANRLGESGIVLDELNMTDDEIAAIDRIYVIACGTSYHVGLIAKDIIEGWAKIPVSVEIASEFSYANVLATENTLCVVITQSGETADTLASARRMKAMGCRVFSICNVIGCTAAREADGTIYVQAGPEICVASTKAYTSQMTAAFLFALYLAHHTGRMTLDEVRAKYEALCEVPDAVRERVQGLFACGMATDDETRATIREVWERHHVLIDTHTAVGMHVLAGREADCPRVCLSTASPFKFPADVLGALGADVAGRDGFACMDELERISGIAAPAQLSHLRDAEVLHEAVCEVDAMPAFVEDACARLLA